MLDFGKHAVFIWGAYGAVFVVLAGLTIWLIARGRVLAARLADFEARGITRRRGPVDQVEEQ